MFPKIVSGLVGDELRRAWARSADACVAASFDEILGNIRVAGKKSVVMETLYFSILGM